MNWCEGPSPSHPDPELFGYNQWRVAKVTETNIGEGRTRRNRHRSRPTELDVGESYPHIPSNSLSAVTSSVAEPDYYIAVDQEVQVNIHIEVEDVNQEQSLAAGMFFSYSQDNFNKCNCSICYLFLSILTIFHTKSTPYKPNCGKEIIIWSKL